MEGFIGFIDVVIVNSPLFPDSLDSLPSVVRLSVGISRTGLDYIGTSS